MRKYISIALSVIILMGVIIGLSVWITAFNQAIQNYRSPLRTAALLPQPPLVSPTDKVVMVLISGLGYDNSLTLNLPFLEKLQQTGASAAILSTPPTYAQTAQMTLVSGAPPETNDAPPLDTPLVALRPSTIDTIFARAHEANLQTALLGYADWRGLIPSSQLGQTIFMDVQGSQADEFIFETALPLLKGDRLDFMLIHFTQLDFAATYQGGLSSPAYQEAAQQLDAYLAEIGSALDLSNAVFIVLADYGHLDSGGHGGAEEEVIWQPFIMVGQDVIPGSYSNIHQTDIAPTIATLLGIAPPSAAQGRILFEMLDLDKSDQTVAQLTLARQRLALAYAYAAQLSSEPDVPPSLSDDLAAAQTAFTNNNIDGALQLATLAQEEADVFMQNTRNYQVNLARLKRLPFVLLFVGGWFMILWRRQGVYTGSIIIATIVVISLYHGLYQLQGYSYSLSAFPDFSSLPIDVARRTAVSLFAGGGLLLIFLMLTGEGRWHILLGTGYGFSVLVTFIFILPFWWGYWQNGFTPALYLPEVTPAFWQITSGFEAMVAAALGLLLPWPIMAFALFVNFIRYRLGETKPPQPKQDILPGLRL
jgi:hypothetical protein